MWNIIYNKKGLTLVEVMIAIALLTIGIISLLSLQSTGYSLAGKSDHFGRAAGILHEHLETIEYLILNPCNNVTAGPARNITVSGLSGRSGDITYTVTPTITPPNPTVSNFWLVTARVTWTGNPTGISESRIVTRQEPFRFPVDCNNSSNSITY